MEAGRGKQVNVDESEVRPHKPMRIEEAQDFFQAGDGRLRQRSEKSENLGPTRKTAASKFADDEGMAKDLSFCEQ